MRVPQYDFRRQEENGTWATIKAIEAPNDYEALIKAKQMNLPGKCELWEGSRLVAAVRQWRPDR